MKFYILLFFLFLCHPQLGYTKDSLLRALDATAKCKSSALATCLKPDDVYLIGLVRKCLKKEILFISIECENELNYFYENFQKLTDDFLKVCKKEVLQFCTEDEIKDTSFDAYLVCSKKYDFKKFSKTCFEMFNNIYH